MEEHESLSSYACTHLSIRPGILSLHPSTGAGPHKSRRRHHNPGRRLRRASKEGRNPSRRDNVGLPPPLANRHFTAMATNRERQVGHMTGFPPAVYPFAFNSIRSHSPFDLLANSSLFGRFGADLPKEMAALCKYTV
ncbi:hypothetical protein SKAU_G00181680 [Synaphobranchus kaupii]|uniref:Uncharacterized protein n=1 Tax=Synaphobranchus kaupii TaxID=118154 RepID=A0A9Q1FMB1_SYNKA|nr:hypothetical protein SKAU_G00181680 [Synaphobranchus kaupii]